ncbi:MAG: hypothetical protein ACRDHZ_15815, partial [Ktedonobacteraceae bacterium]
TSDCSSSVIPRCTYTFSAILSKPKHCGHTAAATGFALQISMPKQAADNTMARTNSPIIHEITLAIIAFTIICLSS